MCLFFEHASNMHGRRVYLGHRLFSRNKKGQNARKMMEEKMELATSKHSGQASVVLNAMRLWLLEATDDASCDRLWGTRGKPWPKTEFEFTSMFNEKPWETASLWKHLLDVQEIDDSVSALVNSLTDDPQIDGSEKRASHGASP